MTKVLKIGLDGLQLGAVINYGYTLLSAGVPAPSLVCWDGRDTADTKGF
ncbi:MAG: hypothetical protein ACAF41_31640 [Leptolyngbya sp. BL-A-14]